MAETSTAHDPLNWIWLSLLFLSTPIAGVAVYCFDFDRDLAAICNSYAFSASFWGLYLSPLISPLILGAPSFKERLLLSQKNWILYLTCFTEIFIQLGHSLSCRFLYGARGQPPEWAFFAYSLSDKRWRDYSPDEGHTFGLPIEVDVINWNDGLLGAAVLLIWLWAYRRPSPQSTGVLALAVVFRDATLWRETMEYMLQHHVGNYPHTTTDIALRPHAIGLLWAINGLWLIAPLISLLWAFQLLVLPSMSMLQLRSSSVTGISSEDKKGL